MSAAPERLRAILRELRADWAVLSSPDSVTWATGHVLPIETGPSPFAGGPALALAGRDGALGLVLSNAEAAGLPAGLHAEVYEGFVNRVVDQPAAWREAASRLVARLGAGGRIAVEAARHPAALADILAGPAVPLDAPLARARAVKTEAEVARLRHAGRITGAAQVAARAAARPGVSEVEALGAVRAAIEQAAGGRCALAGELLGGVERTATLGLQPGPRRLEPGDPVLCDLAPRVDGWWGDSCAAFVVGAEPSREWLRLFERAREALDLAMATLRPGLPVAAFDAALRGHLAGAGLAYPHHSGHGIGASVHEWPRLVPGEGALVEAGMVLMVEPGAYVPGVGGARCERMLLVTPTGCESLTDFPLEPAL